MAKKKITKRPSKKGLKQKQKQSQSVVVNINTTKTRAKKNTPQPAYRQQPQYITLQSEPSPPVIFNAPAVKPPALEPVITPVKTTSEIGIQSTYPETVFITVKRRSKIPIPSKKPIDEVVVNLADSYKTPDDITTPIARRTRAQHPLTPDEIETRRLLRNQKAREKRLEKKKNKSGFKL
jgi:hypothetical protein